MTDKNLGALKEFPSSISLESFEVLEPLLDDDDDPEPPCALDLNFQKGLGFDMVLAHSWDPSTATEEPSLLLLGDRIGLIDSGLATACPFGEVLAISEPAVKEIVLNRTAQDGILISNEGIIPRSNKPGCKNLCDGYFLYIPPAACSLISLSTWTGTDTFIWGGSGMQICVCFFSLLLKLPTRSLW